MERKILISVTVILLSILVISLFYFGKNQIYREKYTNEDFNIQKYYSNVDMDQDGIDDQSDILKGVKDYIALKPKYKSKYYANGYPDDEYGVCTDVVGAGLKSAGYDLMVLVSEDIELNRDKYNIKIPDKNIDFRRVRNLKVYLDNNAISLTTDIYNIKEWQGGDIVVFKNHIGIISDVRNKNSVPYVIHHANPFQKNYEEDILEYRYDIIGHYRIS